MKKIIRYSLVLAVILSLVSNVFAVNAAESTNFSEKHDAEIYEEAGMQKEVIGDNLVVYYTLEETINEIPQTRATNYVSKTATGRFYLTSTGDTVAEYSLSVTFWYDGQRVGQSGYESFMGNYASGWYGQYTDWSNHISDQYMYVRANFDLYHNAEFNNSHVLTIYCDQNGTITVD